MALINVNRNNPDVFYRYKMPKLIAKVEGKGNGIKTVISNMTDIAKSLMRPATYPTKYFGCELGAQTQFDIKRDRYIVNGAHEGDKLQDLLDGFIRKFVLCPECENPETVLTVHPKAGTISQKCQACGYAGKLDMRHKLTTFILKNPPVDVQPDGAAKGSKKKSTDGEEHDSPEESHNNESNGADETGDHVYDDDEDVDWGEDTTEEAAKKRANELSGAAAKLTISSDLEKTPQERADLFFEFVKTKKTETGSGSLAPNYRAIVAEAERLDIKDKAVLILAEILLSAEILKDLKEHRNLFLSFTGNNDKAQKYLLGAFEKLVGVEFHDRLIDKTPIILKAMYDLDLVDEETFLDWSKRVSKKYVSKEVGSQIHTKAEPFIKWLKTAEEEESSEEESEEEEEDGVEVAFTYAEKAGIHAVPTANTNGKVAAGATAAGPNSEEDVDINLDEI